MPDEEITILIRAVDDATQTLKRIETNLVSSGKNIQKTTENTGNSFTKTQGALLQLGQVAQSVHNIWETYESSQRMVANAQDRVENATIRLKNAQEELTNATRKLVDIEEKHARDELTLERAKISLKKATDNLKEAISDYGKDSLQAREATLDLKEAQMDLSDAQKLGAKKSQELSDASKDLQTKQENLKISQNALDIAQRRLEKTTNDVTWAYVSMGTQMLILVGQVPSIVSTLGGLSSVLGTGGVAGAASSAASALGLGKLGLVGSLGALGGIGLMAAGGILAIPAIIDEMTAAADRAAIAMSKLNMQFGAPNPAQGGTQAGFIQQPTYNLGPGEFAGPGGTALGPMGLFIQGLNLTINKFQTEFPESVEKGTSEAVTDVQNVTDAINDIPTYKEVYIHINTTYD